MSSSPPTTLGKYQIIREIARSNDIVYEAYDPLMHRRVALKELAMPPNATEQQKQDRIRRFEREVKAAGSLSHPNIVTIFEFGVDSNRHYMAMEFLDGHTLRNEIDTNGFLKEEQAVHIAVEVLNALQYAHEHGVIHRDIKPENIQILEDGRVKLTDFGIARLIFESNITMDGQVFGTPSYMSPEQIVGKEIDIRSDIFSMGSVLYEMVSGKKPFTGDSVVAISFAIMNNQAEQPQQVSHPLWRVIQQALEKSPVLRYASAKEMQTALKEAKQNLHVGANPYDQSTLQSPFMPTTVAPPLPMAPPPSPYPYGGDPYAPYDPTGSSTHQQQQANTPYIPPYGGQQYGGTSQGPHQQVPIYYPRQPLIKPETKQFIARLFLTLAVVGTLFILVIVSTNAIRSAITRYSSKETDENIRLQLASQNPATDVNIRIKERLNKIPLLSTPEAREDENRNLAVLYHEQGMARMKRANYVGAEDSFNSATELDPKNPVYHTSLARLFQIQAESSEDRTTMGKTWELSAQKWLDAAKLENNQQRRLQHEENAAVAFYNAAAGYKLGGERSIARELLYRAEGLARPGSRADLAIRELLTELLR